MKAIFDGAISILEGFHRILINSNKTPAVYFREFGVWFALTFHCIWFIASFTNKEYYDTLLEYHFLVMLFSCSSLMVCLIMSTKNALDDIRKELKKKEDDLKKHLQERKDYLLNEIQKDLDLREKRLSLK